MERGGSDYQAAGIVFENDGVFRDAYYVSKVVINASYINSFEVQPVLFVDRADAENLVYDEDVYLLTVNIGGIDFTVTQPNDYAIGEASGVLRSSSSLGSDWFYYPADRYPSLLGLEYDEATDEYLIGDAVDLIIFSKIMNYNTVYHDAPFRSSKYRLTGDIDMNQVSPTAYVTPLIDFSGDLSGDTGSDGHYYISRLKLANGVIIDGNYHAGLFSYLSGNVSKITFYDCSLIFKRHLVLL